MSELLKIALSPATVATMAKSLKGFGSGAGMGGLIGAAGGAAVGAGRAYSQAREQGAGAGSAALHSLAGLGPGALRGGLLGAGVGGAAGALRPGLAAAAAGRGGMLQGASNFGQRQVHALSGVGDAKYVRSIGGGAADARERLVGATKGLRDAPDTAGRHAAMKGVDKARRSFKASEKAEAMGLTSIPGYAKALYKNPKEALLAGAKDQWHSMGTGGKAAVYGLPALGVASELARGDDAAGAAARGQAGSGEHQGRFERVGRVLGVAAPGIVSSLPIAGDIVAGAGLSGAFGRLGRGVDRLTARKPRSVPMEQEPSGGTSQAEGYVLSDRAAGTAAEGMV